MSVSTAKRLPSLMRPIAMPATCAFSGTPASISARQPPHTEAIAGERVDALRITLGAERGRDHGLRLTTGEQRRAVHARQHAVADLDLAHGAGVATVDARLAGEDLAAHDARFDVEQQVVELDLVE